MKYELFSFGRNFVIFKGNKRTSWFDARYLLYELDLNNSDHWISARATTRETYGMVFLCKADSIEELKSQVEELLI